MGKSGPGGACRQPHVSKYQKKHSRLRNLETYRKLLAPEKKYYRITMFALLQLFALIWHQNWIATGAPFVVRVQEILYLHQWYLKVEAIYYTLFAVDKSKVIVNVKIQNDSSPNYAFISVSVIPHQFWPFVSQWCFTWKPSGRTSERYPGDGKYKYFCWW